jgi:hypothetical protein
MMGTVGLDAIWNELAPARPRPDKLYVQ